MLEIHDIKPIVEIPDITIYIYYGLIVLAILFTLFIIYTIYKIFKAKKTSVEKEYFSTLQNINFENTKESSYLISKYGRLLATNEREKRLIDEIHHSLEVYKYKKDVPQTISTDIKTKFNIFMDSLDVK